MRIARLGLFAHYCGIRPWETELLTVEDFLALCDFVDEANKQAETE